MGLRKQLIKQCEKRENCSGCLFKRDKKTDLGVFWLCYLCNPDANWEKNTSKEIAKLLFKKRDEKWV